MRGVEATMPEGQWPRTKTGEPASDLAPLFERMDFAFYLLTVRASDGEMSGCLAGFVTQCSIDPPNFVACISRLNHTLGVAVRSSAMGLHLLGEDQVDMARLFGEETGDEVDKFADVDWRIGTTGAPLLAEVSLALEGTILGHFSVGDHEAFLVRGVRAVAGPGHGLLTYRKSPRLHPGHPARS
jgi:flavin reductase (DIM6/NTAB) family NADH-FMN oxidoreductase RutF